MKDGFKIYCIVDTSKDVRAVTDVSTGLIVKGEPKYIGRTIGSLKKHLNDYVKHANKGDQKSRLYKGLRETNLVDSIPIEIVSASGHYLKAERKWIKHFRDLGYDLWNTNDGGGGPTGYVFPKDNSNVIVDNENVHVERDETLITINGHITREQYSVLTKEAKKRHISRAYMIRAVLEAWLISLKQENK